jgi:hypothetical protein
MDQHTTNDGATCPECGAPRVTSLACWEQLGLLLAWEYEDPELQAEHFLTVASYNLQHPAQFTDEALARLCVVFIDHLDSDLAVEEIRRRVGRVFGGNRRLPMRGVDPQDAVEEPVIVVVGALRPARNGEAPPCDDFLQ